MSEPGKLAAALKSIIEKKIDEGQMKLPTLPVTAARVMELVQKGDPDARAVVRAVEKDPVLAAQLMRTANTVAFRGSIPATSLNQAVMRLGTMQLRAFLMTAVAVQLFQIKDKDVEGTMKQLRAHSMAVAMLARDLAQLTRCNEVEEAYVGGLLHDVGKVVVMIFVLEVLRAQAGGGRQTLKIKPEDYMSAIAQLHRGVGVKLIGHWSLPPYVAQIIQTGNNYNLNMRVCAHNLVVFANAMTKRMRIYAGESDANEVGAAIMMGRSILGIDEDVVDRLCMGLDERVKEG